MKALFFSFMVIFLNASAFGLNSPDTSLVSTYNKIKYNAESLILKEKYCESITIYEEMADSFKMWNGDLQNALIASLLCNDLQNIERFSLELLKRGAPHEFFENELDTFTFFESENWQEIKNREIDYSFDPELREKIIEMHKRDQRDRYDEANRPLDDYLNLIKLNKITLERGFPTAIDLGFNYNNSGLSYNRYFSNILLHLVKLQPWDFGEWLPTLYLDSKMVTSNFIYLMAFARTCDDLQLTCFGQPAANVLFVDDVLFTCDESNMKRINYNRALFYLDSIEDQIEKVQFRLKNSEIPWKLDTGFARYHSIDRKDFVSFSEKLKIDGMVPY